MRKLSAVVLACAFAGCATPGDVEKVSNRLDAVQDRQIASDKVVNGMLQHVETLERDVKTLTYQVSDLRKKLELLAPSGSTLTGDDIRTALNSAALDPAVQQKYEAFLKELPTLAPEKALEGADSFEKKDILVQHFVRLIRNPQSPSRNNAMFVLGKWKPADVAPVLEPYLSDGSVRGDLLKIMVGWDPHEATRQALLKHSTEGTDSWRVMIADALARVEHRDGVKMLIEFLYHGDTTIRLTAIQGLKWATGFDLGYKTYSDPAERKAAAEKWEAWWKENEGKFEFPRR